MRLSAVVLLSILALACAAPKTLVLLDDMSTKSTHSQFFGALTERGHQLDFAHVFDEKVELSRYGDFVYDNLIVFAPTAEELPNGVSSDQIIQFVDAGRNVLVAAAANVSEPIRAIANECGVDFDEDETAVIDHLHFDASDSGAHTLVVADNFATAVLGKAPSAPVLYQGIGHAATQGTRLLTKVLTGSETAYSARPGDKIEEYPQSTGRDTLLVTALQTRGNARVVFSGSLDLFSDKFFASGVQSGDAKHAKSGNEEFAARLSAWNFAERGLLRARDLTHRLKGSKGQDNPLQYRIKDEVEFSIVVEEWSLADNAWVPFKKNDVQLEFVMLDPYIRTTLKHDDKGKYSSTFTLPDVYGVYKFRINYWKKGYSNLEISQQVSVHPFRHNEFERFIDVASPYYLSAFTVFAAFFIFGWVFLYTGDNSSAAAAASASPTGSQ